MVCEQCGDRMWPETVIEVRRGFGISRANCLQGGYCARCKIGASTNLDSARVPPQALLGSLRQMFGLGDRQQNRACAST